MIESHPDLFYFSRLIPCILPAARTHTDRHTPADLLWSLCMSLYYVFQFGYYFNRMDQEECLPLVYRLKDPSLYHGDLYMDAATQGTGIRTFFVYLVHGVSQVMSVEHACFLVHVLCVAACAFFAMRICGQLFPGVLWARLLAPFLAIGKYSFWVVGGNAYIDNQLVPHSVAVVFCTAALYQLLRKKPVAAAFLCGLGTLFQPLLGFQLAAVTGVVQLLSDKRVRWKQTLAMAGLYLLAAAPLIIPLLLRQQPPASVDDKANFTQVYFFFRNRHHFVPWFFPGSDWLHWGGLLALAAFMLFRFRHPSRRMLFLFASVILGGMLLYTLLLKAGVTQACYLQWFKTSLWLQYLAAIVVAGYTGKGLELLLRWQRLRWWQYGVMGTLGLYFFLVVWGTPVTDVAGRRGWYELNDYPKSDLTLLHEWVRTHTHTSARILTVPRDESALSEMQRPLVFSYKAILPEASFMKQWYGRYLALYAPHDLDITVPHRFTAEKEMLLYRQRPDSFYLRITPFDYRIVYTDSLRDSSNIMHYQGRYALRRIR